MQDNAYWHLTTTEVLEELGTDEERGLSAAEAATRLTTFGRNTFEVKKGADKLAILLRQLTSPLILVLIVAGVVTIAIAHYRDAAFIFIAVIVNCLLGFWQEYKAEQALTELKTYLKQRARVIRDGKEREIDAEEIVPGDIIRLAQGDRVPADARVIFANDFQVDESVLTGESLPVAKSTDPVDAAVGVADQSSMLFAGTLVTQGVAAAIVCRTDASTELGKIASLIASSEDEKTPLQKAIATFSVHLSILLGILTLVVFVVGVLFGRPVLEMFLMAVAIAVSAIPEGLPISMTVILAIGVERMAKRKGVVRKLIAAEALGSTTVILTDKTGTLTMAKMVLAKIIPFGISEEQVLARALMNATVLIENPEDHPEAWRMNGRIMETALVQTAALRGVPLAEIMDKSQVRQSMPFNAVQKFSASLVRESGKDVMIVFGAPDILIAHTVLAPEKKQELLQMIEELALSGERVLGLATKEVEQPENFSFAQDFELREVSFAGLLTFRDPVRPGIKHAVERVRLAGVKTIIMTGDHRGTAIAIAREIGMEVDERSVLEAMELATLTEEALQERLPYVSVISRVTPFDKLRIAKSFQALGEVVAMTGDGVNDAPAIKQANVGIAMGTGTDVAIESAGITLLGGDISKLVKAVRLSKMTMNGIKQNLFWAFIYNIVGIPLAAGLFYPVFGWLLSPVFAGLAMAMSSVSVVANSLRIKTKTL